jgi:hypothetical protein
MFDETTYTALQAEIKSATYQIAVEEFNKRKQRLLDCIKATDPALYTQIQVRLGVKI